jgi:hypothetical protein
MKIFIMLFESAPIDFNMPISFVFSITIIKSVPIILNTATIIIKPRTIGTGFFVAQAMRKGFYTFDTSSLRSMGSQEHPELKWQFDQSNQHFQA